MNSVVDIFDRRDQPQKLLLDLCDLLLVISDHVVGR